MNDSAKRTPEPLDRDDPVEAALLRASRGEADDDLAVEFRVAGGVPGQRYRLHLATAGGRLERCSLDCAMSDRQRESDRKGAESDLVASMAKRLLGTEVLRVDTGSPKFLPDTLVGVITIKLGDLTRRIFFAADPDQAAVQGLEPPGAVLAAADLLYEVAARALDMEDVRP